MNNKIEIGISVDPDFKRTLDLLKEEYGEDFIKLNGISEDQLSFTDFIDNFVEKKTIADSSVDSSSNVHNKDIVSLRSEMCKPHERLIAYNKLFLDAKKKYGLWFAKKWMRENWSQALYMHDFNTSNLVSYCYAYDLTRLATEGLYYLNDHKKPEPPKHLQTFCCFVKEFISFASNRTSGACGLPNLLLWMYYFWKKDVENNHIWADQTPEQFAKSEMQGFIYAVNQPYTRDGVQTAFTNTSIFTKDYFEALFGGVEFPDGTFAIDCEDEFMIFQKWFLEEMAAIKENGKMFTFPVNTLSIHLVGDSYDDPEYVRWLVEHNRRWCDSNIFGDRDITSLSNCCRLKSDVTNLLSKRNQELGNFNSIGGTALSVGSVKVSTINFARIAYESNGKESTFLKILDERLDTTMKILDIVRDLIKKNVKKGLLPNFTHGLIDFEHLYNTIGINGIYEVMKYFGYTETDEEGNTYYTEKALVFGKKIFDEIDKCIDEFKEKYHIDYAINKEQVPGETAATKFLKADKLLYSEKVVDDLPLYGNQWIPLGIKTTISERVKICSTFDSYCNGGSIMHITTDGQVSSPECNWELFEALSHKGVTYFAFNPKWNVCKNKHLFVGGSKCPKCDAEIEDTFTRIVGFPTSIKNWSSERKEEGVLRKEHNLNKEKIE